MKTKVLLLLFVVAAGAGFLFFRGKSEASVPTTSLQEKEAAKPVSFEASFEIYTNGTKRIFTDSKYHNKSAYVYLEAADPSIIHVRRAKITWGDFFETLPMKLTKDCLTTGTGQSFCGGNGGTLGFFINDSHEPEALDMEIKPGDRLLGTYK